MIKRKRHRGKKILLGGGNWESGPGFKSSKKKTLIYKKSRGSETTEDNLAACPPEFIHGRGGEKFGLPVRRKRAHCLEKRKYPRSNWEKS